MNAKSVHSIAVVVPVYLGAKTVDHLVEEIKEMCKVTNTPNGLRFKITELVLVNDCGSDGSDVELRRIEAKHSFVHVVWLSRNFGQHAATIAGMAATSADWIVTMDEDGQHDPCSIGDLLDKAVDGRLQVVYATPMTSAAHSKVRNAASSTAKLVMSWMAKGVSSRSFSSFRLISGEIGRSLAAYAGPSVYLDVALSWIVDRVGTVKTPFRPEGRPTSGYSTRGLFSHFWKLALTSGTQPLRYVSLSGAFFALLGAGLSVKIIVDRVMRGIPVPGWTSVMVSIFAIGGVVLISLGVIAEYVGVIVRSTFGQPTYLAVRDPMKSPVYGNGTETED